MAYGAQRAARRVRRLGYPACGADGLYRRQQNDGADHHAARRALGTHGRDCRAVLHGGACVCSFFPEEKSFFKLVGILYMHGVEQGGAGLVGGLVGELLVKCAEVLGARIITGVLLFVSVLIFTGTSARELF